MVSFTKSIVSWTTGNGFSRSICYSKEIVSFCLKTNCIRETVDFNLSNFNRIISTVYFYTYKTALSYVKCRNIVSFWQDDFWHHTKTV